MMSFAVVVIVKATLVCGAAFLLARACRRARASIRHLLFALAFAALIAIPVAGAIVPAIPVMLPAAAVAPADARPEVAVPMAPGANPRLSGNDVPAIAKTPVSGSPLTIPQALAVLWLIGVAVFLVPVMAGLWQVSRLRRTAIPWAGGEELVQSLALARGVRRRFDLVLHDAVAGPMTCGAIKPSIILPVSARDWDEASLGRALRHELEHVARWDLLTNGLSRVICAAYWFHPLVWAAWRSVRLEAERACDDAVVQEDDAGDYAAFLVATARCHERATRPPLLAMAGRDDLAARVAALLDREQTRGRVGRRRLAAVTVAGAIAIAAVASITVVRAVPQAQATSIAAPAPTSAAVSIRRSPPTGIRDVEGRTVATGVTVRTLLIAAFAVRDIENVPYWVRADRFDIVFDGSYKFTPQESKAMQAFLAERFKLVAHRASRDFPVYALVQAQPDRRDARLTPSQLDCSNRANCGLSSSAGRLTGRGVTMAELVRVLPAHLGSVPGGSQLFDRQLMDHTGLSGRFDFHMEWAQDVAASPAAASGLESKAPRFLAALQQQLGLTIESQMAPAPVLVIDSIEPPTEN
jgi:uncharacterized protein (TIGR03435 family)